MQKGHISVQTENIFPIIKKFLYSDHEIFLRELIANAVDATTKLKTLARRGEANADTENLCIQVILDETAKTLTISDQGIGMTEEEVKKYLNQVAFSSAQEFLEKYKTEDANIIGHFGLGFYSAFMVAQKVDVITRSYQEGAPAVKWSCTGEPEYTIEPAEREERGTDVVLHIGDEDKEFLEKWRIEELLKKYCKFLPVDIQFGTRMETIEIADDEETTETVVDEEGNEAEKAPKTQEIEVPNIINNTRPAWTIAPSELTDADYAEFYQELHPYSPAPMFWVHLNVDYPFNLTGILYFPRLGNQMELQRNKIQLYCNQMYVTDEVKGIVPEFLTLLHGVIDSPDIPLNVSRSYLQSDRNVKKITEYITKKVADKLDEMFRKEREQYTEKWQDIGTFVKYGYITDDKFAEKAHKFVLLENTDGKCFTPDEYREHIQATQTDKDGRLVVLYSNSPEDHDSYIQAAKEAGYDVLKLNSMIDPHFIQHLERKLDKTTFSRVDADVLDNLIKKELKRESVLSQDDQNKVQELFKNTINNQNAMVKAEALSPNDLPVLITKPEFMRRMREMQAVQGMDISNMPEFYNVVINTNHPAVDAVLKSGDETKAKYLFDLARLQQGMLRGSELTEFVKKSVEKL